MSEAGVNGGSGRQVLSGLRVIDAGTMVAGPFAGTLLADYGADVIKVEKPKQGDPIREWSPIKNGISLWWKVTGRNKRLITLDLSTTLGRALFLKLVEQADVVIENYRPGTFARWGLSFAELSKVNPRIILLHVSGYGQTGPYAQRPGYGTVAEGISGVPSFTGFPDKPPTLSAFPLADCLAAVFGTVPGPATSWPRRAAAPIRARRVPAASRPWPTAAAGCTAG